MQLGAAAPSARARDGSAGDLVGSFALSYLFAALLIASLLYFAGVWEVLANTRFLDFLIRVGVVKYHDKMVGFIEGVPDHKHYLKSQTPIDWLLVVVAAGVFVLFWGIKSWQFHGVARFYGIVGSLGQHARAYLYGLGINRFFPFRLGDVGTVATLNGQGHRWDRATAVVFTAELFVIFEIAVFGVIGLIALGWMPWLAQIFWPLVIVGGLYLWVRKGRSDAEELPERAWFRHARIAVRSIAGDPGILAKLCVLSLLAFALEDIAAYVIANAFGMGVDFYVLLMGLVGAYIARLIPLSPGGVGQFEWGFAAGLYFGGIGLPEAATIAILDNLIRYVTGTLVLGSLLLRYRVETNLRLVLDVFTGLRPAAP